MPYTVAKSGPKDKPYCVFKMDDAGEPTGDTLGCHPTAKQAGAQIGAIEQSEKEQHNMTHFIRAFMDTPQEGQPLRFTAATEGLARDGMIIENGAWELDNYRRNPVVLWSHDYLGQRPPIGRAEVALGDKVLLADVTFDREDDFARDVERKYRGGFLNAVSVGWSSLETARSDNPKVREIVTKAELLDISAVPVPGDPAALMQRQARALTQYVVDVPDVDITIPIWRGVAAAMVDLFRDREMVEETRHKLYIALERAYKALGHVPPEYLSREELDPLAEPEIRGLFLADEFRLGAMLNARNRGDLEQAMALIQGVLDRAAKEEAKPEHGIDVELDPGVVARLMETLTRHGG